MPGYQDLKEGQPARLGVGHPLQVGQDQQRIQAQQNRMQRPPAFAGLSRPDGSGGVSINQQMPGNDYLMDTSHIYGRHGGDDQFGQSALGSGAMGVASSRLMTGGGSQGSLMAQQAGQARGEALTRSLPPLTAMQPFKRGSKPNTAAAFHGVDAQVGQMAQNERASGHAGGGEDPLVAAHMNYKPQGVLATGVGGGASPKVAKVQAPPMATIKPPNDSMPNGPEAFAPGPMMAKIGAPPTRSVASIGGRMVLPLVGSRQDVQRAQGRINGSNVAGQGGIAGPPAPPMPNAPGAPNPIAQALNGGGPPASPFLAEYQKATARADQIASRMGAGGPEENQLRNHASQQLQLHMATMGQQGTQQHQAALLAQNGKVNDAQAKHWEAQARATEADAAFKPRELTLREEEAKNRSTLAAAEAAKTQAETEFSNQKLKRNEAFAGFRAPAQVTLQSEAIPHEERQRVYDEEMLEKLAPGSSKTLPAVGNKDPDALASIMDFRKQYPNAGPDEQDVFVNALRGRVSPEQFAEAQHPAGEDWFKPANPWNPLNLGAQRRLNWAHFWHTSEAAAAAAMARGERPQIKPIQRPSVAKVTRPAVTPNGGFWANMLNPGGMR